MNTKTCKGLKEMINESVKKIRKYTSDFTPSVGIILGTGLGALAKDINVFKEIPYKNIPHFPLSTVETHTGMLIFGEMGGKKVVAMSGRFHRYEGYSMQQITFPVRVMKALGIKYLLISNAAGGMNLSYKPGQLVIIEDHINFMGDNPLIGPNDNELGPRWPDMIEPYSKQLISIAENAAKDLNIPVSKGIYFGVLGPNLETRAEYRMMNKFADMVGMSTVPEVIVGVHSGLKILGISVITDMCDPDNLEPADDKRIIKNSQEAEPKLTKLMKEIIKRI
ncbi:MAG: purine-nucleoside phosphorylase [Candidatus Goldbacteria bacterium]|nr:purine-nucleoside phosphorylase [Candidatus Goldiibacteriota bacterium]